MTIGIVFPVNNKGGVGKTSVLADLTFMLSQGHTVAAIDTDYQLSLAATLTKDLEFSCSEEIRSLEVPIRTAETFRFYNATHTLRVDVEPASVDLITFPIGTLYDFPEKEKDLQEIIEKVDTDFIALDLPPIPHPGLILDYSLMPILNNMRSDYVLMPIIVATPDKNVIQIGLNQYSSIKNYLESKLDDPKIVPTFLLNKLGVGGEDSIKDIKDIGEDSKDKLNAIGALHLGSNRAVRSYHFKRKFAFNGDKFRNIWLPFLSKLDDTSYSLMLNSEGIYRYPAIFEAATSSDFPVDKKYSLAKQGYVDNMRQLTNYLLAHAGFKTTPFYNLNKGEKFYLRIYQEGLDFLRENTLKNLHPSEYQSFSDKTLELEVSTVSDSVSWYFKERLIPLKSVARAIVATNQEILNRSCETEEEIIENVTTPHEHYPGFFKDHHGTVNLGHYGPHLKLTIHIHKSDVCGVGSKNYEPYLKTLLRNLGDKTLLA